MDFSSGGAADAFLKILKNIDSNLARIANALERDASKKEESIGRVINPLIANAPTNRAQVDKSTLPEVSKRRVVFFYGPSFGDTRFLVRSILQARQTAVICVEFASTSDLVDACSRIYPNDNDYYRRKAIDAEKQLFIIANTGLIDRRDLIDVFVRVEKAEEDGSCAWELRKADGEIISRGTMMMGPS